MKALVLTSWALMVAAGPRGFPETSGGSSGPGSQHPSDPSVHAAAPVGAGASEGAEGDVPITRPLVSERQVKPPAPLLPEGTMLTDRLARIEKDPKGAWWTIPYPRVGRLRLLPCRKLETVERLLAREPRRRLLLSGETYRYRGKYYLMLRKVLVPRTQPASASPPVASASAPAGSEPARSEPSGEGATAGDVARALLDERPARPVVPPLQTAPSVGPAAASRGQVVHRLVRLVPCASGGFMLAFEADNTLQEPPLRVLPNVLLERLERRCDEGRAPGARFYVTGEVHYYHGAGYVLLRAALPRRDMGQF